MDNSVLDKEREEAQRWFNDYIARCPALMYKLVERVADDDAKGLISWMAKDDKVAVVIQRLAQLALRQLSAASLKERNQMEASIELKTALAYIEQLKLRVEDLSEDLDEVTADPVVEAAKNFSALYLQSMGFLSASEYTSLCVKRDKAFAAYQTAVRNQRSQYKVGKRRSLTFDKLRAANVKRLPLFKNRKGELANSKPDGSDWYLAQWSNATLGELGEAANIIKKIDRGDMTLDEARPALMRELADVAIYLDILAFRAGIDLGAAVAVKFNEASERGGCDVKL
jgi:NTP pyrophosphatase (non-canonical NTP hydrolase)